MSNKNTCYRATESILHSYREVTNYIENLEEKLKEVENCGWADLKAVQYDKISIRTFGISRSTENAVLSKLDFIEKVESEIRKNKILTNDVEKALKLLNSKERKVVDLLYFKNVHLKKCIEILKYKERTFYRTKDNIIKKIGVALFGVEALKHDILRILGENSES